MSDNEIRDRLAAALREHGTPLPDVGYPADEYECCAEELLSAGWRAPAPVIDTAEQLAALPVGALISDQWKTAWHRFAQRNWGRLGKSRPDAPDRIVLPATVLWLPASNSSSPQADVAPCGEDAPSALSRDTATAEGVPKLPAEAGGDSE